MAKCKVKVVTGYVPIPDHTRSAQEYYDLGQKLGHSLGDQPLVCYYEHMPDMWLAQFLERLPPQEPPLKWSKGDDPKKNSLEYHCVQHQKFSWLARAANHDQESDTFIWMDYGMMRLPGMNADDLRDFLKRVKKNDFAIPGCWEEMDKDPNDYSPSWRFCGTMMIVPREDALRMFQLAQALTRTYIRTMHNVTWEVNTLARMEPLLRKIGLRWYKADHNVSMLTGYSR